VNVFPQLRQQIRKYPLAHKFIKFGITGSTAALVSLFVFWLISLQFPQYNLVGKAIGYIIGFFVGFTLNKLWTYVDRTEEGEKYLMKYIIVYLTTFIFYLAFNYVCDHIFRLHQPFYWILDLLQLHEISEIALRHDTTVSNMVSIGVNAVLNFIGTNYLVFRVPKPEDLFD
jgi:putative flippase GtrA